MMLRKLSQKELQEWSDLLSGTLVQQSPYLKAGWFTDVRSLDTEVRANPSVVSDATKVGR